MDPVQLGKRIRAARIAQRYSKVAAAKAAKMARDTWTKIESGDSVHDTNRQAALDLLGLDHDGRPAPTHPDYAFFKDDEQGHGHLVGPPVQDATYVESPGARVEAGITNEDLMREILRTRADVDQIAAAQRELADVPTRLEDLSRRVERLESGS